MPPSDCSGVTPPYNNSNNNNNNSNKICPYGKPVVCQELECLQFCNNSLVTVAVFLLYRGVNREAENLGGDFL